MRNVKFPFVYISGVDAIIKYTSKHVTKGYTIKKKVLSVIKDNTKCILDLVLVCSLDLGFIISSNLSFLVCEMETPKYSIYFTELTVPEELMYTKYTTVLWETIKHYRNTYFILTIKHWQNQFLIKLYPIYNL